MKVKWLLLCGSLLQMLTVTAWAGPLAIQAVPANPTIEKADGAVVGADGANRALKAPYIPVRIRFTNESDTDQLTVAMIHFTLSAGFGEEQDRVSYEMDPPLELAPGESKTTDTYYLEGVPASGSGGQYVAVGVSGWKNTGSDPGDEFATADGFEAK